MSAVKWRESYDAYISIMPAIQCNIAIQPSILAPIEIIRGISVHSCSGKHQLQTSMRHCAQI
ncbi:hypothetical protein PSP6_50155 [Paraburkholderia tropica]|nr:hypothetical protein PSP6_50155 [Paraburkholderia tropica]